MMRVPVPPGSTGLPTSTGRAPDRAERERFNQLMRDAGVHERQHADNTAPEIIYMTLYGTTNPTDEDRGGPTPTRRSAGRASIDSLQRGR
jgi:hypothetical protein